MAIQGGGRHGNELRILTEAIRQFESNSNRPRASDIAILLIDGYADVYDLDALPLVEKLRNNSVNVIPIGVYKHPMIQYSSYAEQPNKKGENYFVVLEPEDLNPVISKVLQLACSSEFESTNIFQGKK